MKKTKYLWSLLALTVMAAFSMGLTACGDDDEDGGAGSGDGNSIVGTWRLGELKTESWLAYYDGHDGDHSITTKSYGMSNGTWENVYIFKSDGSYTNSYLDGSRLRSQTGLYSFYGSQITLAGETYDVVIDGNVMKWSHEASRKEIGSVIQATYIKMEYATWYRVN